MGTGGFLRLDHAFANAEASFLMTFAMGGVPHAGSCQSFPSPAFNLSQDQGLCTCSKLCPEYFLPDICLACSLLLSGLPGARVRNSTRGKGHEEGGFGIRKGGIEPQETPCFQASTPKTRVCLFYHFMLSPTPLTLWGAVPHLSWRRS